MGIAAAILTIGIAIAIGIQWAVTNIFTAYNLYLSLMILLDILYIGVIVLDDPHNGGNVLLATIFFGMFWAVLLSCYYISYASPSHAYPSVLIESAINLIGLVIAVPLADAYAKCKDKPSKG